MQLAGFRQEITQAQEPVEENVTDKVHVIKQLDEPAAGTSGECQEQLKPWCQPFSGAELHINKAIRISPWFEMQSSAGSAPAVLKWKPAALQLGITGSSGIHLHLTLGFYVGNSPNTTPRILTCR
jgi:hypothetical protein